MAWRSDTVLPIMKYIVGINLPLKAKAHETGVALIDEEGTILFAMSEERLSRKKFDGDFPERSLQELFRATGISANDVSHVAVPTLSTSQKALRFVHFFLRERLSWLVRPSTWVDLFNVLRFAVKTEATKDAIQQSSYSPAPTKEASFVLRYNWRTFISRHFPKAEIVEVDHHIAHAAGAYFTSPWNESLVITIDGAGNLLSSIIAHGKDGKITLVDRTFVPHSLGQFWGVITRVCGFHSGFRHGGKVTGLAAYGDPRKLIDKMRRIVWSKGTRIEVDESLLYSSKRLIQGNDGFNPEKILAYFGESTREDLAAAAQQRLNEVSTEIVIAAQKMVPCPHVVVAGGVFANVLTNQHIKQLSGVSDLYVFPAMSDGGLALGAALFTLSRQQKLLPKRLKNAYLGPQYSYTQIENAFQARGVTYHKIPNAAAHVARLIADGKVVGLFTGKMEYGPRALGNRTILCSPKDVKINQWLNERLQRSEFMPFAPVTMQEYAQANYIGMESDPIAATFMTVTYACTDLMKASAPACVHIDGTARPQIIRREDNPLYYDIIKEYHALTGIPTLINTSFNMHEEPIVCSPEDAIRSFLAGRLDALLCDDYLCLLDENQQHTEAYNVDEKLLGA